MRVVGGRLKGRNLASPSGREIRPTADRLRESVFNILVHAYDNPIEDARVLDLFAGTGALGIEAASRGARFTLFVDNGAEARALLRTLRRVAREVVWLGPADVGLAPLFRWPWRWWLSQRARRAAVAFEQACVDEGACFVGFHEPAHSRCFASEPQHWFAADGVHPSSAAYRYCFAWLQACGALSGLAARR